MKKLLIFSLGLAFLGACANDAPGPKELGDNSLKSETSFCTEWAEAACNDDVVDRCNDASADDCIQHQSAFCAGLIPFGYSSVNAEECIEAVADAYEDAELDVDELDVVLRLGGACGHLIEGLYEEGEDCTVSTDCNTVRHYECVFQPGAETGTCQIPEVQSVGDPCDEPQMVCEEGTYCAALAKGGSICATTQPEGEACATDAECDPGNLCEIAEGAIEGECAPKLELKDACSTDSQCASGFCFTSAASPYCADSVTLTGESSLCVNL